MVARSKGRANSLMVTVPIEGVTISILIQGHQCHWSQKKCTKSSGYAEISSSSENVLKGSAEDTGLIDSHKTI